VGSYDGLTGYSAQRRADPRIAAAIRSALADASSVINVGAGAGSYEPVDLDVVAVEPSATMIAQRPPAAALVVQASAEALPFADGEFDAAMALLTVHHWTDLSRGLSELQRVARDRVVILHWDPALARTFWLVDEYVPEVAEWERDVVSPAELCSLLGGSCSLEPVPVPHDCTDGFHGAYWRRPEAYLDPSVRAAMSGLAAVEDLIGPGLARLRADLESGAWHRRHADLLDREELDIGYRLVVASLP
jgi:SAM-dependent methyltransferase